MKLLPASQEYLPLDQLHTLVAEGYRQSYNIGVLEKMLSVSKIDDDLEAANGGGTFFPVLRIHSVSTGQIQNKMDEAAESLLVAHRTLMQQLIGRAVTITPEPEDNPAESAWIVPRTAEDLVPEVRTAFQSDDDVVIGTVGALSLYDGVIAILPRKGSGLFEERSMVCVKAVSFTGKQIYIRGNMRASVSDRSFITIRKKERAEMAKKSELSLFSKLPDGLFFRVLLPNSLESHRV